MSRTAVILGASGFIGRNVCKHLAEFGWQVHAITRPRTPPVAFVEPNIHQHVLELQHISRLRDLPGIGEFSRVGILNCIGYGVNPEDRDQKQMIEINACFPVELARHAGEWGAALVHIGSSSEYAPVSNKSIRLPESAEIETKRLYGSSKAQGSVAACMEARQAGGRFSVLRLFNAYGEGEGAYRLFPTLLEGALSKTTVPISSGTQIRDFLYVKDIARAIKMQIEKLLSSEAATASIYNLCSGQGISVVEFSKEVLIAAGGTVDQLMVGSLPLRPDDLAFVVGDNSKFCNDTGWQPRYDIAAAVRDVLRSRFEGQTNT